MNSRHAIFFVPALLFTQPVAAAGNLPVNPGKYDIVMAMSIGGGPASSSTRSRCILAEDLVDPEYVFTQENARGLPKEPDYKVADLKLDGSNISYFVTRGGRTVTVAGTVSADNFAVTRTTKARPGEVPATVKVEGKRTGNCKK